MDKIEDWYEIKDDKIGDEHDIFTVDTYNRDSAWVYIAGQYDTGTTHDEILSQFGYNIDSLDEIDDDIPYALADIIVDEQTLTTIGLIETTNNISTKEIIPLMGVDKAYTYNIFNETIKRIY